MSLFEVGDRVKASVNGVSIRCVVIWISRYGYVMGASQEGGYSGVYIDTKHATLDLG